MAWATPISKELRGLNCISLPTKMSTVTGLTEHIAVGRIIIIVVKLAIMIGFADLKQPKKKRIHACEGLGTRFCPYWLYCGLLAGAGAAPPCRGRCPYFCSVYCCFVFFVHSLESVYNAGTFCKLRSFRCRRIADRCSAAQYYAFDV